MELTYFGGNFSTILRKKNAYAIFSQIISKCHKFEKVKNTNLKIISFAVLQKYLMTFKCINFTISASILELTFFEHRLLPKNGLAKK